MNKYFYDLHIHSCLSPCGDDDSTPNSIAGMGKLNSLNIMALTDHNTCKNCPAFFKAAISHGILPVAGMELTTGTLETSEGSLEALFDGKTDTFYHSDGIAQDSHLLPFSPENSGT